MKLEQEQPEVSDECVSDRDTLDQVCSTSDNKFPDISSTSDLKDEDVTKTPIQHILSTQEIVP